MRPAARLLLAEAEALPAVLERAGDDAVDRPTVLPGWTVRDVLAHCGALLRRTAEGRLVGFTPEANQRDVDERRDWPLERIVGELLDGYRAAAEAVNTADGYLDGIGLGEWIHGGDVRHALEEPDAYASAGVDLAIPLLVVRSRAQRVPPVDVRLDGRPAVRLGGDGAAAGRLETDVATFVRLCAGRRPDPSRYRLDGVAPEDLVLFT